MNTIGFVVGVSPNGTSLSGVIHCCSAQVLTVFARGSDGGCDVPPPSFQTSDATPNADLEPVPGLIGYPETCVSGSNTLVNTIIRRRAHGAKNIWFADRRAASAALVRNDDRGKCICTLPRHPGEQSETRGRRARLAGNCSAQASAFSAPDPGCNRRYPKTSSPQPAERSRRDDAEIVPFP